MQRSSRRRQLLALSPNTQGFIDFACIATMMDTLNAKKDSASTRIPTMDLSASPVGVQYRCMHLLYQFSSAVDQSTWQINEREDAR